MSFTYTLNGETMKMKKQRWWVFGVMILLALCLALKVQADTKESAGPLGGVVLLIDAGHGGKDNGAMVEGVMEQEINLAISLKLKTALETQGATVVLTRDGAYDLASDGATNRKREDMKKRVDMINEEPTDLFISVHLNSYPNVAVHGAHAFYQKDHEASKAFAQIIQKHFNALTNDEKESKVGDYYILNNSMRPGILVECGFLSNQEERNKLIDPRYQEQLADAMCQSVLEYLDVLSL